MLIYIYVGVYIKKKKINKRHRAWNIVCMYVRVCVLVRGFFQCII